MFPPEIWEKILENVGAAKLTRLRTVNSTWDEIITKLLQDSNAWYRQCKADIPEKYWLMLLENSIHLNNLHQTEDVHGEYDQYDSKTWMTVYRAWLKWDNVQNYNVYTVNEFKPIPEHRPSERITCCAVLGELVAIGSTEGYIRIFNLRTNKIVFFVDQYEKVTDVKLCVHGKNCEKIILIATSNFNKSRTWDITSQNNLKKKSGDLICAGYGYYCIALCDWICIYDAKTEDCYATRLSIKDFNTTKQRSYHPDSMLDTMKYVNMIINKYQLCFWSDTGLYCELDLKQISQPIKSLYTPDVKHIGIPKKEKVRNYYLFNPYVAFCVTERGYLGVSVCKSKWQFYNVFPFLEGVVTAILFYVRVLVIGLDSGDVILYSIENELSLKRLNFNSEKSKRINVASEAIVSVNIMEISGDQRLLVATKNTVYHIKLESMSV